MTATQDMTFPTAADVACDLADLLGLGLPDPGLISIYLRSSGSISLQFSGPDHLDAVAVWASYFNVPVVAKPTADGTRTYHEAVLTLNDTEVNVYAVVKTDSA